MIVASPLSKLVPFKFPTTLDPSTGGVDNPTVGLATMAALLVVLDAIKCCCDDEAAEATFAVGLVGLDNALYSTVLGRAGYGGVGLSGAAGLVPCTAEIFFGLGVATHGAFALPLALRGVDDDEGADPYIGVSRSRSNSAAAAMEAGVGVVPPVEC